MNAKNPHFMFCRDYMDYHSDRFKDYSLIFENEKGNAVALLPANLKSDNILVSHQGLTFGGLVLNEKCSASDTLKLFEIMKSFLSEKGIKNLFYKCMPYIYSQQPAEEDLYALFINKARLVRRDISSTIFLDNPGSYSKGRKWTVNKSKKADLTFERSSEWAAFWNILKQALVRQHQVKPVHTLEEITRLAEKFPENIKLFVCRKSDKILSGTVIYENKHVVHTQYMANSEEGREIGALDLVIDKLIKEIYSHKWYFDFGNSNENDGLYLNTGLIAQKEGFGARAVVHDFYEMEIR
jgi:hypothetical protein